MLNFLKQTLSGDTGPSAKRFWLSVFSALFIFMVIRDSYTGKHPQDLYSNQVFQLVIIFVALVFLERFIPVLLAAVLKKYGLQDSSAVIKDDQPKQ